MAALAQTENGPKAFILLFVVLLSTSWSGCARHAAVEHDLSLPSGERVTKLDTHGDFFTDVNGAKRHVFYISYDTAHDIDDVRSLRKEALRVWGVYLPQIAGDDYDSCVVTPVKQTASGGGAGRPFYLTRRAPGTWILGQ